MSILPASSAEGPARRRRRREAAALALNTLLLVGLALGLKLPALGPLSLALAYLVLFALPGYLLLRLLIPGGAFDPITTAVYAVALGAGALSIPVVLANALHRLDFGVMLLIHAGGQVAALAVWLRQPLPDASAPARRLDPVWIVYAAAAVAVIGAVILSLASFDLSDAVNLGGTDHNVYVSVVNRLHDYPARQPQPNTRGDGVNFRLYSGAWAYEQALIAWATGLTPLQVVVSNATAPLLALVFLTCFALSFEATRRVEVALLSALFTLATLTLGYAAAREYTRDVGFGERVLRSISEDKVLTGFVLVPAAVALTLYLLDRAPARRGLWSRLSPWLALLLALAAVVGAHPVGFGQYLAVMGAYLLVRLLANPTPRAWLTFGAMALALLAVMLLPLAQLLVHRLPIAIFDWASTPLDAGLLRVAADGAYILHPGYVSAPVFVAGIALGLLMAARARRDRAAQYLFAATAGPLILVYTPYLTSTLGNLLKADNLERLLWVLPTGLAFAYAAGLALDWVRPRATPRLFRALAMIPLAVAVALAAIPYRSIAAQVFDRSLRAAWPERATPEGEALAEVVRRLAAEGAPALTPVLAPAEVNTYLYMTVSDALVYHFRVGYVELHALYQNPWWGEDAHALLEDFAPAYFVAENGSHAHTFARLQPARYAPLYANARYTLYRTPGAWPLTDTDRANTLVAQLTGSLVTALLDGDPPQDATWAQAIALYERVLRADPEDHRARYGLAFALAQTGDLARAETLYREVLAAFLDEGNVRVRLADVLRAQGRTAEALDLLLAQPGPATLRAALDQPYLGALDSAQLVAALDAWEAAPAFVSGPHPSRALAARLLRVRGDQAGAVRALEHIPPGYRTSHDLQTLGTLYLIDGDAGRALAAFEADAGRSAEVAGLTHLLRGHLAMQAGDYRAAQRAYQAAADTDPIPAAWVFTGQAAEAAGDLGAAEGAYRRAAALDLPPGFWAEYERYRAGDDQDASDRLLQTVPETIAQNFWGEAALYRFYIGQGRAEEAEIARRRALTILEIAGIPPFPPEHPPQLVSPLAPGVAGARANLGVPGDVALASFAVRNRTLAPPDHAAVVTLDWLSYDQAAGAAWWQFKVVAPDGSAALGAYSQAALTPAGGMARWTFAAPVNVEAATADPFAPADVLAVAVVPGEEGEGVYTYRAGQIMLGAPPAPEDEPAARAAYVFGDQIELTGYTLPASALRPGETLRVSLFWRAVAPPPTNLTAFVHLLDAADRLPPARAAVAQADAPPGPYPTSLWEAGARVQGVFDLALPDDLAPGTYSIFIGVYEPSTFARLPVEGWPDGAAHLTDIEVWAR